MGVCWQGRSVVTFGTDMGETNWELITPWAADLIALIFLALLLYAGGVVALVYMLEARRGPPSRGGADLPTPGRRQRRTASSSPCPGAEPVERPQSINQAAEGDPPWARRGTGGDDENEDTRR
jgi:hypothetical protein